MGKGKFKSFDDLIKELKNQNILTNEQYKLFKEGMSSLRRDRIEERKNVQKVVNYLKGADTYDYSKLENHCGMPAGHLFNVFAGKGKLSKSDADKLHGFLSKIRYPY